MFAPLDASHLTFLFVATVAGLTTALIWMFCELERSPQAQRVRQRLERLVDDAVRSRASQPERDD